MIPAVIPNDVIDRFHAFQSDPGEQIRVKLRRVRAAQIRRLFARPELVTLDTFNRDVWVFESESLLNSEPIKELYWNLPALPEEQKQQIETALDANDDSLLILHGNYVWGSATRVYGPMLKDIEQRPKNVQQAVRLLNEESLSPEEKADLLKQIPGFGNNIATGLVMLFHPDRYAIYNSQSDAAMRNLGYDVSTLPQFQAAVQDLKVRLGATDFLELELVLISGEQSG